MNEITTRLGYAVTTGRAAPLAPPAAGPGKPVVKPGKSFGEILSEMQQTQEITFSKHAQARTDERNIKLSQTDLDRLGAAMQKAQEKGLRDTLIFMNDTAFIVNIPSKVVVTVMDNAETHENVFTNIDGAVIL